MTSFLSNLMKEVYNLLGIKKVNAAAYYPQTEQFNRTLTDMLSKEVKKGGKDWDQQLPFVLFAYRASIQELTGERPFLLVVWTYTWSTYRCCITITCGEKSNRPR